MRVVYKARGRTQQSEYEHRSQDPSTDHRLFFLGCVATSLSQPPVTVTVETVLTIVIKKKRKPMVASLLTRWADDLDAPRPLLFVVSIPSMGNYAVLGIPLSFWFQMILVSRLSRFPIHLSCQSKRRRVNNKKDVEPSSLDFCASVLCHLSFHCQEEGVSFYVPSWIRMHHSGCSSSSTLSGCYLWDEEYCCTRWYISDKHHCSFSLCGR